MNCWNFVSYSDGLLSVECDSRSDYNIESWWQNHKTRSRSQIIKNTRSIREKKEGLSEKPIDTIITTSYVRKKKEVMNSHSESYSVLQSVIIYVYTRAFGQPARLSNACAVLRSNIKSREARRIRQLINNRLTTRIITEQVASKTFLNSIESDQRKLRKYWILHRNRVKKKTEKVSHGFGSCLLEPVAWLVGRFREAPSLPRRPFPACSQIRRLFQHCVLSGIRLVLPAMGSSYRTSCHCLKNDDNNDACSCPWFWRVSCRYRRPKVRPLRNPRKNDWQFHHNWSQTRGAKMLQRYDNHRIYETLRTSVHSWHQSRHVEFIDRWCADDNCPKIWCPEAATWANRAHRPYYFPSTQINLNSK